MRNQFDRKHLLHTQTQHVTTNHYYVMMKFNKGTCGKNEFIVKLQVKS